MAGAINADRQIKLLNYSPVTAEGQFWLRPAAADIALLEKTAFSPKHEITVRSGDKSMSVYLTTSVKVQVLPADPPYWILNFSGADTSTADGSGPFADDDALTLTGSSPHIPFAAITQTILSTAKRLSVPSARAVWRLVAAGKQAKDIAGAGTLTLTGDEWVRPSVELTGAKTGKRVIDVPAAPTGLKLVRNLSTGDYAVIMKLAAQAEAAGIELAEGDNVVIHHGGSLALMLPQPQPPTAGTHRTASHTLVAGDIGQWNSFRAAQAIEISLAGSLGAEGDRILLACRSAGNFDIDLRWVDGTIRCFTATGITTLNAAGTAELIGSGGNQRAIFTAIKTGATEWTVHEGVWVPA